MSTPLAALTFDALSRSRARHAECRLPQLLNLISEPRCLLELEVARELHHLRLELLDALDRLLRRHRQRIVRARLLPLLPGAPAFHDVRHRLDDGPRRDAVNRVVF